MKGDLVRGHLNHLILAVLAEEPSHGYAVMQALYDQSDGFIDMPEGSIYPALYRLERQGLVLSERTQHDGRERRVYRLTSRGQEELVEARSEWQSFIQAVASILRPQIGGIPNAEGTA